MQGLLVVNIRLRMLRSSPAMGKIAAGESIRFFWGIWGQGCKFYLRKFYPSLLPLRLCLREVYLP